ncbi:Uncharacterised protein [Streptococcus pneumoniae]|nr:Uncharacterised protein [Streptococcus pneumoniae]SUO27749.1 Uncharacterised protein [Streptococcus pneumoniae]
MNLSNDGFVAFHYRSYGTFFLQQNRLHNIYSGFTHYKYYRAHFYVQSYSGLMLGKYTVTAKTFLEVALIYLIYLCKFYVILL